MKFSNWFKRRKEDSATKLDQPSPKKIPPNQKLTEQEINEAFMGCDDITQQTITLHTRSQPIKVIMYYCPGLCDLQKLNNEVIPTLEEISSSYPASSLTHLIILDRWKKSPLCLTKDLNEIITAVFTGKLLLIIQDEAYLVSISDHPQRNPEETRTEISIRGARDGFIEEIEVNAALIRKRLPSNSLRYEVMIIGRRSKTKVGLFYIDDIAVPDTINEIRTQLQNIDIDALIDTNQLEELLIPSRTRLFPMYNYTGRPDFVVEALLSGRFAVLIDGAPTALIAPVTMAFLLKTAEDNATYFFYNSAERMLRLFGLIIATSLPGFWIALVTFHQNEIPFILLASLAQVRQGIPLPFAVEAFIMILIFELFREAGLRLPAQIGQILSVVGGLIIGDAAIRAGLTNPAMIVIIATSAVANFALVNQSLAGTIGILRAYILVFSSFLGMFGFFIASYSILLYVANLRSYGIPYLAPLSPFNWTSFKNTVFRPSWRGKEKRPAFVSTQDSDRKGGEESES